MPETLIPVGSIVRFAGTEYLAVILGYFVDNNEQLYDYLTAPYPAGLSSLEHAILANEDDIAEVVYQGYLDQEGERALQAATDLMKVQERLYVAAGKAFEEAEAAAREASSFKME